MAALQTLLGIVYPVVIYLALQKMEPRQIALALLALLVARVALSGRAQLVRYTRAFWLPLAAVALVAVVTAAWNDPLSLLLAPSFVNAALFTSFGLTLVRGEPMIERFARAQVVAELSQEEIAHCRRMTWLWCAFFLLNGSVALWLALVGNLEAWTIYTGIVSYILIGGLLAGELLYRTWRFRRYEGAATDAFFRRLFPPPGAVASRRAPASGSARSEQASPTKLGLRPVVLAERSLEGRCEQELVVPSDLACWPGHFPELSLLPGVVQLDWVMELAERRLGRSPGLSRIEGLKFTRPVLPGQKLTLILELPEGRESDGLPTRARFRIEDGARVGAGTFAQGRIALVEDEAAK